MKKLNMTIKINPVFSADDWQLYTSSMDCTYAAQRLNEELAFAVNSGFSRQEVQKHVHSHMSAFDRFGAGDSEPIWFLEKVLDEIFGAQDDWK